MTLVNDLKPGSTFLDNGSIYVILDIARIKCARGAMVIKVKVRNLRSGANTELSYTAGDKVEEFDLDKREMTYLYDDGDFAVFMDTETYDQVSVSKEKLKWEMNFIVANQNLKITYYNEEVIGIELPVKVELEVVETTPAVRGDTVTRAMKDAILETGFQVKIPLFIEQNERIIVNTTTGLYDSRA